MDAANIQQTHAIQESWYDNIVQIVLVNLIMVEIIVVFVCVNDI